MVQAVSHTNTPTPTPPPASTPTTPTQSPTTSSKTSPNSQTTKDIQTITNAVNSWNGSGQSQPASAIQKTVYDTLNTAASQGRIDQVLSGLSSQQLTTVGQILDHSGNSVTGPGLSQGQRDALFTSMARNGASPQNLAKLANSLTYGADVAGVLQGASQYGQIDQVLGGMTTGQISSMVQKLDGGGDNTFLDVPALSQTDRNNLFNSIVQGSFLQGGASPANIAKLANALTNGADLGGLLTAASNSAKIDQVLSSMNDKQLASVAQKLSDGSLSQSASSALINAIVAGTAIGQETQGAAQLARLTRQLALNGNYNVSSYTDVGAIGTAVARSTDAGLQLDYFNAMKPYLLNTMPLMGGYTTMGMLVSSAVAPVLASMSGSTFTQAVQGLSDDQLKAIMQASPPIVGSTRSTDLTQLDAIINAAATSSDALTKERVFLQGANILSALNTPPISQLPTYKVDPTNGQIPQLTAALTNLLQHDTIGQMTIMSGDMANAKPMTAYLQELLNEGKGATITGLLKGLAAPLINNPKLNPADWINQKTASGWTTNAHNLAFLVGTTEAALYENHADAETTASTISSLLGTAITIGNIFVGGPAANLIKVGTNLGSAASKFDTDNLAKLLLGGDTSELTSDFINSVVPMQNGVAVENAGTSDYYTYESATWHNATGE